MEINKTDKELAIDVAIAYINGVYSQNSTVDGIQRGAVDVTSVCNIIKSVHTTLASLDDK